MRHQTHNMTLWWIFKYWTTSICASPPLILPVIRHFWVSDDFHESPYPLTEPDRQFMFASFLVRLHQKRLYVLFQTFSTIAVHCCFILKLNRKHESFVDEFWLHCSPSSFRNRMIVHTSHVAGNMSLSDLIATTWRKWWAY